jgi:hypothetical protein
MAQGVFSFCQLRAKVATAEISGVLAFLRYYERQRCGSLVDVMIYLFPGLGQDKCVHGRDQCCPVCELMVAFGTFDLTIFQHNILNDLVLKVVIFCISQRSSDQERFGRFPAGIR